MKLQYIGSEDLYEVYVYARATNVIEVKGIDYMPSSETGFNLIQEKQVTKTVQVQVGETEAQTIINEETGEEEYIPATPIYEEQTVTETERETFDYSAYNTLYKTVTDGCYQYSNDGAVYVPPTKTITVMVSWDDNDNEAELRPESVSVTVNKAGETEEVTLDTENNWAVSYSGLPKTTYYFITEADDVDNYEKMISGTTVIYSIPAALEPTVEEQIEELTEVVADLDERVYTLEEGGSEE